MSEKTTYIVVVDPGSDFDKSLKWFVESSRKNLEGLQFCYFKVGCPVDTAWELIRQLEEKYGSEG